MVFLFALVTMPLILLGCCLYSILATAVGDTPYVLRVVSHSGGSVTGNSVLAVETIPAGRDTVDTVVFVGREVELTLTPANIAAAMQLLVNASRVASSGSDHRVPSRHGAGMIDRV